MTLTPAKMKRVDMVILDRDERRVTAALGKLGVLHLVQVRPDETLPQISRKDDEEALQQCRYLLARLDSLADKLGTLQVQEPAADESHEPIAAIEKEVATIEAQVSRILAERAKLQEESAEIQDELVRLDALGVFTVPLSRVLESPFMYVAIGTIRTSDLRRLAEQARKNIILLDRPGEGDRRHLIAITSRKGRFAMETLLRQHNFEREDISRAPKATPAAVMEAMQRRLGEIKGEMRRISRDLAAMAENLGPRIAAMRRRVRLEQALLEASLNFGHTGSTCLISGWLPEDYVSVVSNLLLQETQGRLIVQVREPEETGIPAEEIPVLMRNPPLVRPFEVLVSGFGMPKYKEIEPTLLVAISFLIMYGLMFGDVGHGAVLAILGFLVHRFSRSAQTRDIGFVTGCAGVAATLGGFLYGSIFGKDDLLPALLVRPMEDVLKILQIPVAVGVLIISAGVILNIINKFRAGDYLGGILDRYGVIGIVFYWGAIGLTVRYVLLGSRSPGILPIVMFLILPLAILLLREVIHGLFMHGGRLRGALSALMAGGVDVMETVSSYLANTFSFARVGAFALAHAGLCIAIFSLEEIVRDMPGGALWSAAVFILGNALILLLEGLIVFIQCLRLEYYEFFSKFFDGSGMRYRPFRLG